MSVYLGIDLTNSERRASAWALLDDAAHIVALGRAYTGADLLAQARTARPASVAIDAPLFLPRGLSSLDMPAPAGLPTGRACERALKRLGIGCFYTTPRSIIKPMVYRAITLRRMLESIPLPVLEVFPYATKVRLLGRRVFPTKMTAAGRRWQQEALSAFIPHLATMATLGHDELDAVVAAYTGLLHNCGRAEALGDPDEGLLWLPAALTR